MGYASWLVQKQGRTTLTAMIATIAPANSRVSGVSSATKGERSTAATRRASVGTLNINPQYLFEQDDQQQLPDEPSRKPCLAASSRLSGTAASSTENNSSFASTPGAKCTSGLSASTASAVACTACMSCAVLVSAGSCPSCCACCILLRHAVR